MHTVEILYCPDSLNNVFYKKKVGYVHCQTRQMHVPKILFFSIFTGGGRINEVIRIKHVRRIKHAFEKWVFCFFLRRIKHVRVLFDFLNFSCVVTR